MEEYCEAGGVPLKSVLFGSRPSEYMMLIGVVLGSRPAMLLAYGEAKISVGDAKGGDGGRRISQKLPALRRRGSGCRGPRRRAAVRARAATREHEQRHDPDGQERTRMIHEIPLGRPGHRKRSHHRLRT